ncbi:Survival of motor neuron-related-splicing factor 30 [Glycine soja]
MQGQGVDEVNIEELASNLSLYKDQLNQVRQLLNDDPSNSEYADMERELSEVSLIHYRLVSALFSIIHSLSRGSLKKVIALTEELLATAKQNEIPAPPNAAAASPTLSIHNDNQVLDSSSDHQEKLPVGTKVQAVWSEDGEWYDATVEAYTPNGYYVSYDNWGNKEEVDPANIRSIQEGSVDALLEAERVAEATKQAIKRKIVQAASIDLQSRSLPAKLRIEADDPEDVKASKRKKIHAFKSKMRMEQLEVTQNKRQNAWQQFQSTKGKAKKIGFFSGRKRESIFKSPDDPQGKVGVTGSGKGLTEFQKREKHFHLKDGTVENDE